MGKRTESNQPSPRAAAEDGPSLRSWLRQLEYMETLNMGDDQYELITS